MIKLMFFTMILIMLNFFYKKFINQIIIPNLMMIYSFIFLLVLPYKNFFNYIYFNLGIDTLSSLLMILSLWIIQLCLININTKYNKKFYKMFFCNLNILLLILMLSFSSMNLILFYIMFESSLIPLLILIMGWGLQISRIQASMYMLFYTLMGSLPLLMMILLIFKMNNSLYFMMINLKNLSNNLFFYLMIIMAFLIKLPMFFFHIWLPKAHVEAPISGSMILAGIMLKLGSYGMYRILILNSKMFLKFNLFIFSILMIGSLLSSIICLNQSDMKLIVAYSSVVHMGVMMASMLTLWQWSFNSSVMMMVAHGLCSSGLFYLVNLNYERLHSRSLMINKGLINIMPKLSIWWFLLSTSNFSAPPSLNLFSEMMIFNSIINWSKFMMIFIIFISFFSTSYSIYLYSMTQYNKIFKDFKNFKNLSCKNYLIIMMHWMPLNIFFMKLLMFF